jgi:hypothetical protein
MSDTYLIDSTVIEFSGDPRSHVALDDALVQKVSKGDDDPQFVTLAVKSGRSKNKRNWPPKVLRSIAEQIRKDQPVGYLGHIPEKDDPYAFPDVQTIWLGATLVMEQDGSATLYYKGYNMPESKARSYLERGAVNSTSWRGNATLRAGKEGYDVEEFELESIDWSRKGKEGMESRVLSVTSEMEDGVEPKDIAALTLDEFRQHNPLLFEKIVSDAKAEANAKVKEMEEAQDGAEKNSTLLKEIREKLGIEEGSNPLESITSLLAKVEDHAKEAVKGILDDVLQSKVKSDRARGIVRRLVTVGEMKDGESTEEYRKRVEESVDEAIEKDEDVKALVSEMSVGKPEGGRNLHSRETDRTQGGTEENEFIKRTKVKR